MFGQCEFAPVVAFIHTADLGDRDVGFVREDDGVVGDEFEQGRGWFARCAACEVARVVFDAVAHPRRLEHFEIEVGALFEPLRFEQFAFVHELVEAGLELFLDLDDRLAHRRFWRDVVGVGVDADVLHHGRLFPRQRVEFRDAFQFLAKEGQPPCPVVEVGREDFERVAPHPEGAPEKRLVVAFVLLRDEVGDDLALVVGFADLEVLRHRTVGFHRSDAVDAGDGGHDDHVVPFQKSPRGRMAHAVDLFVDLAFLLYVGVGARHVGLGLVVVIETDEIFDGVVGKEPLEFAVKLGGQRLVGCKDDGGALGLFDHLGHGVGLARAGGPQQHLVALARHDARAQFPDGRRLVAGGLEFGVHAQALAAFELEAGADIFGRVGKEGVGGVGVDMGHEANLALSWQHARGRGVLLSGIDRMPGAPRRPRAFLCGRSQLA